MKQSSKAKRIARHKHRAESSGKLNLVSLMDIFTILVFFLMVNSSSDVQVLNQDGKIELPVSVAEKLPEDAVVVTVTATDIIVAGRRILSRDEFEAFDGDLEPLLSEELSYLRSKASNTDQQSAITLMADKDLPYSFLRKLMATCIESGYSKVALAVGRVSTPVQS